MVAHTTLESDKHESLPVETRKDTSSMKHHLQIAAFGLLALTGFAHAQDEFDRAKFERGLHYQTGQVSILDGKIKLNITPQYRFLNQTDARKVLEDAWGNPPDEATLGMILPAGHTATDGEAWAVELNFDDDGYVSDKDASSINYNELLKDMQQDALDGNAEREKAGYQTVKLIGWASAPKYDAASHKLYWAKELEFGADPDHTLNYNVRVLGRYGVLNMNAIASMKQLPEVQSGMQGVLNLAEFSAGNRYEDYQPGDKVSQYGIAALVAGGVLATKTGLLAKIGALLIAGKKLLIPALIAVGAALKKVFGGKQAAA